MSFALDVNVLLHASDTHLAALLLQHGVTKIYTCDRDFRKYDFLEVQDPLV